MIQNVSRRELVLVLMLSLTVALVSARPYAGSWNDGSRLALVESLVDFRTLSIDRSIFADPAMAAGTKALPYDPQQRALMESGTLDKVMIKGRFYSHQPMVPALFMAACYQALEWIAGLQARSRPDLFVYAMTLISSGLAYVAAVLCIHLLGRKILSGRSTALAVTISFALGSSALAYTRQVNSHEGLLAVAAALLVCLHYLPQRLLQTPSPRGLLAGMGLLTGLGYSMDYAAGPLLLIAIAPLIIYRCRVLGRRGLSMPALFLLSALPLIVLHHALNYHIGGTFRPVATVAEYLFWPGSPFDSTNATGPWHHRSIWRTLAYALELLFGEKGFLLHQPVLILAFLGGIAVMIRKRALLPELPEMLFSLAWSGAVWLVYAWGSNNLAGSCATIRWFVPLLAPGYYILLMVLRYRPVLYPEFLALAAGGMLLSALMWRYGPWMLIVPGFWFTVALTLLGWSMVVLLRLELSIVFLLFCLLVGGLSPKLLDMYRLSIDFQIPPNPQTSSQIDFDADAYFNRGAAYCKLGEYRQAIPDFDRAIGINPKYAEAYYSRGAVYGILGNNTRSIPDFDRAIDINPKYAEAYYSRGVVYGLLGNNTQAISDYDRAIDINPKYAEAYYNRGVVYGALGNNTQAIPDYDRAIEINPNYAAAHYNRGLIYCKLSDYRQAIPDFDRVIEINPKRAEVYYNRGIAYAKLGEHTQAISDYDRAIEINPKHAEVYYNRGIAYEELGDKSQAISDYDRAIGINPTYAQAYYSRGIAYGKLGNHRQAISDYDRAVEINPEYAEAYNNLGIAYGELGDKSQAISDYDRAIEINPEYAEAYNNRGAVYGMLGNNRQAISDYDRAIEINAEFALAYINRGVAHRELGEHSQAISDFDRAVEINPGYARAYYNRGAVYDILGDNRQAIQDFDRAVEINPKYADAYNNRGVAYGKLGEHRQAISDFDRVIEINPEYANAYYNRGVVYGMLRNQSQSIVDLQKAARLDSEDAKNSLRSRGISW